jgi:hypothetical protein
VVPLSSGTITGIRPNLLQAGALLPIEQLMVGQPPPGRRTAARGSAHAFELIVRGDDGQAKLERFTDARAYRARLVELRLSSPPAVSIDEIARLLDS